MLALAGLLSGICYLLNYRLLLWRRSGKDVDGDNIWRNLRVFCGWMCSGCAAGTVGFILRMQQIDFEYDANMVSMYDYSAASGVFVSLQFFCDMHAMFLLLRRVSDHASHSYYNIARDQATGRMSHDGKFDWRDCIGQ